MGIWWRCRYCSPIWVL